MPSPAATMPEAPSRPTIGLLRGWRGTAASWGPLFIGYWAFLFYSTHTPIDEVLGNSVLFDYDKLLHAGAYFVLTTFALIAWRRTGATPGLWGRLAVAAVVLVYGAFDEITQPYVGRDCSLYDWFADGLGAGLAITLDQWRHRGGKSE